MLRAIVFLLFIPFAVYARAQPTISFKHVKTHVFDNDAINKRLPAGAFGGISAIEPVSAKDLKYFCDTCTATGVSFLLFSDKRVGEQRNVFLMRRNFEIAYAMDVFALQDFEGTRYNAQTGMFVSSYETDSSTGLMCVNTANGELTNPLFMPNPTVNRGIEGLTFAQDNSLWFALETGNPECADKTVSFYNLKYDRLARRFREEGMVTYRYPLDKCACLEEDAKNIDGANGNGVTDILTISNMPGKLLVLERCFSRKTRTGSTYLYLASINEADKTVTKDKMLFDFNTDKFPNAGRNIEGMCWADEKTLLLVADDNFSDKQVGQVIELRLVK